MSMIPTKMILNIDIFSNTPSTEINKAINLSRFPGGYRSEKDSCRTVSSFSS